MTTGSLQNNMVSLAEALRGKVVVTDTSSLLMAGTDLLDVLGDCHLVIPAVVVSELEDKRSHGTLGFLARTWLRLLEDLRVSEGALLKSGVPLGDYQNLDIQVEPNHSAQESLPKHLRNGSNDSTILAVAQNLSGEGRDVVLLSNDMPMRLHATLDLGIAAHEFNATQLVGAKPFNGRYTVDLSNDEYLGSGMHRRRQPMDDGSLDALGELVMPRLGEDHAANAVVDVTLEGATLCTVLLMDGFLYHLGHKNRASRIEARTPEQDVALEYLRKDPEELPIVSLGGGAGTGKTLLTMATAIEELRSGHYQKVIVFRSLHEMGQGQEMGFLPGTVAEKMEAWAGAVFDAIDVLAMASQSRGGRTKKGPNREGGESTGEAQKAEVKRLREMVEISPITYLRGRSLANTFMVLEEAQNFSRSEILNILSRVGQGSKIVITFDAAQVDNRFLQSGKNADIWSVIDTLQDSPLFAHITLVQTERSQVAELASRILEG